jgi:hypothetical protein
MSWHPLPQAYGGASICGCAMTLEAWILPSQSLALRAKRGDGIIAPRLLADQITRVHMAPDALLLGLDPC